MSQHQGLRSVLRRWPSMLALTVIGVAVAAGYLAVATPHYTAHTDVLIAAPAAKSTSEVPVRTLESYAHVAGARVIPGTSVLRISAESTSAGQAAQTAQKAADAFLSWVGEQKTDLTASVVEKAAIPQDPSSPSVPLWLVAGALVGLLAGLVVAGLRQVSDRSIHTPAELEDIAGAPVLGAIAFDRSAVQSPLITSLGTHHPRFEAVRILRTNLQFLDVDQDNKVITITSPLPGEGKSTTACNLAIALAQTGSRVILVEGDLRRPRVSEYLGIEKSVGVTTVLVGRTPLDSAIQSAATPGLDVLTSGALPPNPSEILQTSAMRTLISDLRHRYDVVLIDAPPLLPITDASLLASISDGALLVVRHGRTRREDVRSAAERVHSVGARLLGTVLTMSPAKELSRYGYGYGYGPEYFDAAAGGRKRGARRA